MSSDSLTVRLETKQSVTRLFLQGTIDKHSESIFEQALEDAISSASDGVILDLDELIHLNSGAIALMLKAAGQLKQQNRTIEIINVDNRTMMLLELIGLDTFISIAKRSNYG